MVVSMRVTLIAFCIAMIPGSAWSESSIEESVFEDCSSAQEQFSRAAPDEQKKIFDFLARVITLNTQAPGVPEPFAQLPGQQRPGEPVVPGAGRGADVVPGSLWQTMDAKRELNGKRCALSIFGVAGASALSALPKLIEISSHENLSDEIAVTLEETAAAIAEQAHRAGVNPSDTDISAVTPLLTAEHPLVARNYLHEYVGLTLPHVTKHLSMIDGPDGEKVVEFLRDVDPDGSRGMRAFLDLLVSLPDEQQQRLGRQLPLPSKQALPGFVGEFARLAADSLKTATFMPILGKSCIALDGLTIDPTVGQALSQRSSFDSLDAAEQRCLIRSIPPLTKRVTLMLSSQSTQQQLQAIELLASAPKSFTNEQKGLLWSTVRERAVSSDPEIQKAALRALASNPEKKSDTATVLAQILKSTPPPQLEAQRIARQQALDSLALLVYSKDLSKLTALALASLSEDVNPSGPISFLSRADDAEPGLLTVVQQGPLEARRRALEALAGRTTLSSKVAPAVLPLLDFAELAPRAERVLAKLPPAQLAPQIRKALPRATGSNRAALLVLLQLSGSATKGESSELVNLLNGSGCSQLAERGSTIQRLLARKDVDSAAQTMLRSKCDECLSQLPDDTVKDLLQATPAVLLPGFRALSDKGLSDEAQENLLAVALDGSSAPADISAVALSFIAKGSRPARLMLLSSPKIKDAASAEVTKAIHELLEQSKNDDELRFAAIRALISINDTTFDWKDFVKHAISEMGHAGDHHALREVIRLLPVPLVLDEVSSALNSDNQDKIIGACRVGAALGSQAVPIVSKVWSLREHRAPAVRYSALLALLDINPLTPDLQEHLKRLLVNRYYPWALGEPIPWRNTVAVVDLNAASFGTLRTVRLEALLRK